MNSLERKVLQNVGENPDNPDVFLDTDAGMEPIRDSINDAIQEIAMITGGISREYNIPLVAGQAFYRLKFTEGYFGWVRDAWLTSVKRKLDQTDFIKLNKENPRWLLDNGPPTEACGFLGRGTIECSDCPETVYQGYRPRNGEGVL